MENKMRKIELTSNQALKVFHGDTVRIRRNGSVMYVERSKFDGQIIASTWGGTVLKDVQITGTY